MNTKNNSLPENHTHKERTEYYKYIQEEYKWRMGNKLESTREGSSSEYFKYNILNYSNNKAAKYPFIVLGFIHFTDLILEFREDPFLLGFTRVSQAEVRQLMLLSDRHQ